MKALNQYSPETRDSAESMLENAYLTGDRLQGEFFADAVGDDSIEISRLLLALFKATSERGGYALMDAIDAMRGIENRLIANACEGFDTGALT